MLTSAGDRSPCRSNHGRRPWSSSASPPKITSRKARSPAPRPGGLVGPDELAEGRGGLVQDRHAPIPQQLAERLGRATDPVGDDDQLAAIGQGAPDFPDREIERERMKERPHVVGTEVEPRARGVEQPAGVRVGDGDALGPAGRARGVDDIRQVRAGRAAGEVVRSPLGFVGLERDDLGGVGGQAVEDRALCQQDGDRGVGQDQGEPFGGIHRVERDVGPARLEDRQQADDHPDRTLGAEAHERLGADAQVAKPPGQAVRAGVQLGVGERQAVAGEGDGARRSRGVGLEAAVERTAAGARGARLLAELACEQGALLLGIPAVDSAGRATHSRPPRPPTGRSGAGPARPR